MKHKHHIIPRHMGGTDDPSNLVSLTIEEHAEAHKKLWEEHGIEYDRIAWQALLGQMTKGEALYEAARVANTGRPCWRRNVPCPQYIKDKISKTLIGNECHAKKFKIVNTYTQETIVVKNLKKYCIENGLHYKSAHKAVKRDGKYKNYTIIEWPETANT